MQLKLHNVKTNRKYKYTSLVESWKLCIWWLLLLFFARPPGKKNKTNSIFYWQMSSEIIFSELNAKKKQQHKWWLCSESNKCIANTKGNFNDLLIEWIFFFSQFRKINPRGWTIHAISFLCIRSINEREMGRPFTDAENCVQVDWFEPMGISFQLTEMEEKTTNRQNISSSKCKQLRWNGVHFNPNPIQVWRWFFKRFSIGKI